MATTDQPDPPSEPPVGDADTAASPPEHTAEPAKAAPLDDVVASLIEERPRPHLSVVPPPRDGAADDVEDPLAAVLDQGAKPEDAGDAWAPGKPIPEGGVKVDLGKFLELGGLTGGLQKIAGWIEKTIPALNDVVSKLLKQVEVVITSPDAFPVPGGADASKPAGSAPPLTIVPDEPEVNPGPDPAPIRDPDPMPDPNPGNDPLPIHDPPPPLDPDPGRDPLPIGDPIGDPAPMRDPIITGEATQTEPESEPDPVATD